MQTITITETSIAGTCDGSFFNAPCLNRRTMQVKGDNGDHKTTYIANACSIHRYHAIRTIALDLGGITTTPVASPGLVDTEHSKCPPWHSPECGEHNNKTRGVE